MALYRWIADAETYQTLKALVAVATAWGRSRPAPLRGEIANYDQLLRIEQELGERAVYAGWAPVRRRV